MFRKLLVLALLVIGIGSAVGGCHASAGVGDHGVAVGAG